jgi:hypothetical protein
MSKATGRDPRPLFVEQLRQGVRIDVEELKRNDLKAVDRFVDLLNEHELGCTLDEEHGCYVIFCYHLPLAF